MGKLETTSFMTIYDSFYARVTDDLFLEITELETMEALQDMLVNAIDRFEFPRFDIYDYELGYLDSSQQYQGYWSNGQLVNATVWNGGCFHSKLTEEEVNILSLNMVIEWLSQQMQTTENTRMKFSGSDFKLTSQANHLAKLKVLRDSAKTDSTHMQRLYKRRNRVKSGAMQSTMGEVVSAPTYGVDGNYHGVTSFWSSV